MLTLPPAGKHIGHCHVATAKAMSDEAPKGRTKRRVIDNSEGEVFSLGSIYPNPFFGVATISFSLAYTAQVRLELLTIAEEPVHLFIDKTMKAGSHKVVIDRESIGLRSGNYMVRITFRNIMVHATQLKMITVR